MDATEIVLAFNTVNTRKTYNARAYCRPNIGDIVYFDNPTAMCRLGLIIAENKFQVTFQKAHGQWGDYVMAISKALYNILNTLEAGGAPFRGPPSFKGITIETVRGDANEVYVSWPGMLPETVEQATMPELEEMAAIRAETYESDSLPRPEDFGYTGLKDAVGQPVYTMAQALAADALKMEATERAHNGGYTIADSEEPEPLADFLSFDSRIPTDE